MFWTLCRCGSTLQTWPFMTLDIDFQQFYFHFVGQVLEDVSQSHGIHFNVSRVFSNTFSTKDLTMSCVGSPQAIAFL